MESVERMKRNAGVSVAGLGDSLNAHGEVSQQARAEHWHEHGHQRLQDRASAAFELGDHRGGARASAATELGDHRGGARASAASEFGDHRGGARAGTASELGEHLGHDRASTSAERYLGEAALRDRASLQGGHPHQRALRQDREVVEDGDLKSIPIQLPQLPSPEGRDASLEAGDWLIQLEPLIGDLSKNAAAWWRRVMEATTSKYAQWLHADPLTRLRITAPENAVLSTGYERLDQRVTSLLLQSVPKSTKDEIIAARELTTTGILFRVLRTFQPGGLVEKSRLLQDLTTPQPMKSVAEAVTALRLWKRKASRAAELCTQLPDPLLLVRTLDSIARPIVEASSQASFELPLFG